MEEKKFHRDDLKAYYARYFVTLYIRLMSLSYLPNPANWKGERLFDSRQKDLGTFRSALLRRVLRTNFRHDYKTEIYDKQNAAQGTPVVSLEVYPYTRLPTEHHIRVLMLQPGERGQPLIASFQLINYNDSAARYHALSYTWGIAPPSQKIDIDGCSIAITENLYDALQHMRFKDKLLGIWVDAVSINQKDNGERSSQVSHMGDIYTNAYSVLIWLGKTTVTTKPIFDLISSINYLAQNKFGVPFFMTDDPFLLTRKQLIWHGGQIPRSDDLVWKELEEIFWRPWWTRTWTKQEICLASYAVFFCGDIMYQADGMLNAAQFLTTYGLAAAASLQLQHVVDTLDMRTASKPPQKPSLLDLLFETRSALATNAVDKIYGLLGLCSRADADLIRPDYTLLAAQVYRDVARSYLQSGSLDILSAVCDDRWREVPNLPSWAPDWSVPPRAQEFITPIRSISANATRESIASPRFDVDDTHLTLDGVIFDTVDKIMRPLMPPIIDTTSIMYLSTKKRKTVEQTNSLTTFTLIGFRLKQWERFARKTKSYPTGEDVSLVHIKTIIANAAPADLDLKYAYGCYGRMRLLQTPGREMNEADSKMSMQFKQWVDRASYGRTFFRTKRGYFGIGPLSTTKGDPVVLFAGAKTPFVLLERKIGDSYSLRGECYVHGIMNGEAWNKDDTQQEFCLV